MVLSRYMMIGLCDESVYLTDVCDLDVEYHHIAIKNQDAKNTYLSHQ